MLKYRKRKVLADIHDFLSYKEAIVLYGARQVGKTTIMKMLIEGLMRAGVQKNAIFYFDLEDLDFTQLLNKGVEALIKYIEAHSPYNGKIYVFIDEIQYLDEPARFIKLAVDNYSERIKIIVSGSSVLDIKAKVKQSLVGRIITFEIFGLDFEEFLWFKGHTINFKNDLDEKTQKELRRLFEEFVIFGSYPRVALISEVQGRKRYLKELIQTYIKKDIRDIGRIRNIMKFNNFIRILADQAGSLLNVDNLAASVGIARETVYDYLALLEGTYVIRRLPPFFKNLKSELTKMPKIYFEDTGVLNYLKYHDIIEKVEGTLFENAIFVELRKNDGLDKLRYWRTQSKKEIDFVVDRGKNLLVLEVKTAYARQSVRNIKYFFEKYSNAKGFVVTLNKRKDAAWSIPQIYPWEIDFEFGV